MVTDSPPPKVPFLGVYLSDLTFIEDSNHDTIEVPIQQDLSNEAPSSSSAPPTTVKLINFEKNLMVLLVVVACRS
jgi:hypothetical protein